MSTVSDFTGWSPSPPIGRRSSVAVTSGGDAWAKTAYARVSTLDQDLDVQLAKLKAEGCGLIRSEKVSGNTRDGRTELATVLEFLQPGDELVVIRLDRLGRDTSDVQSFARGR